MSAAKARADATAPGVGKAQLAAALKWSRPRLDRRLNEDPNFPVIRRGDQSGGWKFDLAVVISYLSGGDAEPVPQAPAEASPPKPPAIDKKQLAAAVAPPMPAVPRKSAEHKGEASARQRKDSAQADLYEDKVRLARGDLAETAEIRAVLNTMCAGIGRNLDGIPEAAVKLLGLPDTAITILREMVDDVRRAMYQDLAPLLAEPAADE